MGVIEFWQILFKGPLFITFVFNKFCKKLLGGILF
jgi:hypothetical protein